MTLLPVREATQVEKVSDLDRFGGGGDHPKAARDVLERSFAIARGDLGLCEEAQQFRVLARLGSLAEPARDLGAHRVPIMPLDCGLGREAVERQSLHRGEWLVAEEVVEAPAKAVRDDLERAHRRADQAGLHPTDETLGLISASPLRLAHSQLS